MRLVIDMQGAQTESRFRGIGRYSLSLALAIARNRGEHEVILALSELFPDTIEPIRAAFEGILPQENIRVWGAPGPTRELDTSNERRRLIAERIREAFILGMDPDAVLVTSLFEGMGDDAVTSVGIFDSVIPTAVILYDLIPLINPDINFRTNAVYKNWYSGKIASLKRSQLYLAISESSRNEALNALNADARDVINISGACDASFRQRTLTAQEKQQVCRKVGILRPFVMYTGGADDRKNLPSLIEAFANLPGITRRQYQLALVGKMPSGHVKDLMKAARRFGLAEDEVIFTGYVEDDALINLYNCCALFVFPSLHEGFGLPPLEAMSCGAPVIAANATSLPEVVGLEEALFDPCSVQSITAKLEQALSDESFRQRLAVHAMARAAAFSWDVSAQRALQALSRFDNGQERIEDLAAPRIEKTSLFIKQNKRILLLKLDHMGDLILAIPAITKVKARYPYASIDIIVGSWNRSIATQLNVFDNIYTLDYFKKISAASPSVTNAEIDALTHRIGDYDIAIDLRRQGDTRFILAKIRAALRVGYETFNPAVDSYVGIRLKAYQDMPHIKTPLNNTHISEQMLRLIDALPNNINDYVSLPELSRKVTDKNSAIAIFPTAGNDVKQWNRDNYINLADLLVNDSRIDAVNIYFANETEAGNFAFKPHHKLRIHSNLDFFALVQSLSMNTICVANNSFGAHIASYAGCLVLGIYGGHETYEEWAPVFGESYVIHTGADCSPCHIASRSDCTNGLACLNDIPTRTVFNALIEAIGPGENNYSPSQFSVTGVNTRTSSQIVDKLIESIAAMALTGKDDDNDALIAQKIACNHRIGSRKKQLLVDISELIQRDAKSGIQRVVRAILRELLLAPPEDYVVEPVYATINIPGYYYARHFTSRFLESQQTGLNDTPVEAWPGDIFLGLDLHPLIAPAQKEVLLSWRRRGVSIIYIIYDLLPVLMPQSFAEQAELNHHKWLETIASFDGAIAISKAVADEMHNWLRVFGQTKERPFRIGWFHLGADLSNSVPTVGIPDTAAFVLSALEKHPSFLMVGTLEPRKGYAQTLAAFELLWQENNEINLIIVGKQGWLMDGLVDRLRNHPKIGRHLFWLESISDEYLDRIYAASNALIVASEGEGFGLPLVEAAKHKLAIIARDIPVFREVAGEHAFYFTNDNSPEILAAALRVWLDCHRAGTHPRSDAMPWLTWKESKDQLLHILIEGAWQDRWLHDGVRRFWGSDSRLHTRIGMRNGKAMCSTGHAGHLIYGPYISLPVGQYRILIHGDVTHTSGIDWFDVVFDLGRQEVLRRDIGQVPPGKLHVAMDFTLENPVSDFEIRFWVGEGTYLAIDGIEIIPTDCLGETAVSLPHEAQGVTA